MFHLPDLRRGRGGSRRTGWLLIGLVFCLGSSFGTVEAQNGRGQRPNTSEDRKVRHILVREESRADQIIQQLQKGASFAVLCRRYSLDVVTKPVGGELGFIGRQSEPQFDKAAYSIGKIGEFAKCQTRYGWHVIELQDIRSRAAAPTQPPAVTKPTSQPGKPNDAANPNRAANPPQVQRLPAKPNEDIEVDFEFIDNSVAPGEDVLYRISLRNNSDKPQEVFNPDLWQLGITVRYQFGRLNLRVEWPSGSKEPEGGFSRILQPQECLEHTFRMQDMTSELESWPIIRTNWRANIFFMQLEKNYPQIRESIANYEEIKRQWRFYSANSRSGKEQYLNVLPEFERAKTDQTFVMLHARGKLWFELATAVYPGVHEYWIDQMRSGAYNRQAFLDYSEGQYFHAGGSNEDGTGHPPELFELRGRLPKRALKRGDLALEIIEDAGRRYVGTRYFLILSDDNKLAGRALTVGHLLGDETDTARTLEQLTTRYEIRGNVPRTMLGLVYTTDLLPESVVAVTGATSTDSGKPTNTSANNKPTRPLPQLEVLTGKGSFRVELFEDAAPNTVANFITLAEQGFYNGLKFHHKWSRSDNKGFIQAGSPDGSQAGGAGYSIPDEISKMKHLRGSIAFARGSRPNSGSSQFYICLEDQPFFDGNDTVFGRVISGMNVVDSLEMGDKIETVKVLQKRGPYTVRKAK